MNFIRCGFCSFEISNFFSDKVIQNFCQKQQHLPIFVGWHQPTIHRLVRNFGRHSNPLPATKKKAKQPVCVCHISASTFGNLKLLFPQF